jgi:hypothetical protein
MKKIQTVIIGLMMVVMVALPITVVGNNHLLINEITEIKDGGPIDDVLEEIFICPDDQVRVCTHNSFIATYSIWTGIQGTKDQLESHKSNMDLLHQSNVEKGILEWLAQQEAAEVAKLVDGAEGGSDNKKLSQNLAGQVRQQCKDAIDKTKNDKEDNDYFTEQVKGILKSYMKSSTIKYTPATCLCLKMDACKEPPVQKTKFALYLKEGLDQGEKDTSKSPGRRR